MQNQTRISFVKNGELEIARNANKQKIPFFARQINHQPLLFSQREAHIALGLTRSVSTEFFALFSFSINDREINTGIVIEFGKKKEISLGGALETRITVSFVQAPRKIVAKLMISHALHSQVVMVKDLLLYDAGAIRNHSFITDGPVVIEPKIASIRELMPKAKQEETNQLSVYWTGKEPAEEIRNELERLELRTISSLHDNQGDLLILNGGLDWHPAWFSIFLASIDRKTPCITSRDTSFNELNPLLWNYAVPRSFEYIYVSKELLPLVPKSVADFGDLPILWKAYMMGYDIQTFKGPGVATEKPVSDLRRGELESQWATLWKEWTRLSVDRIPPRLSEAIPRYPYRVSIITMTSAEGDITELYRNLKENPLTYFSFEWIVVYDGPTSQKPDIVDPSFSVKVIRPSRQLVNFSEGNNIGVKHATGEFVVFLNDDVRLTKDCLDKTVISLVMDDSLSGASPVLRYPDGKIQHAGITFHRDRNGNSLPDHSMRHSEKEIGTNRCYAALTAALVGMRTADVIRHNGFDVRYYWGLEDIDLCLRMGGKYLCLADYSAVHEEHATTNRKLTETAKQAKNIRNCAHFIRRHKPENIDAVYMSPNIDFSFCDPQSTSIIITSSTRHLLVQCLNSLDDRAEVIVVTNARQIQNEVLTRGHKCVFLDEPWSYSKFNNRGAMASDRDVLIFLNDDIIVRTKNWIEKIHQELRKPGCGAAGATLVYEDGTTQFQGINFVSNGPLKYIPEHIRKGKEPRAKSISSAALTGACFGIRRDLFFSCGGFSEHYKTECQDTDLSLVLLSKGYSLNISDAVLVHLEGASRKTKEEDKDRIRFKQIWKGFLDQLLIKRTIRIWTIRISDTWGLSRVAINLAVTFKNLGHDVSIVSSDIEPGAKAQLSLNGVTHKIAKQASDIQESADLNIVLSAPYLYQMDAMKGPAIVYNWGDPPWALFPASYETRRNADGIRSQSMKNRKVCHGSDFLKRTSVSGPIVYPGLDHTSPGTGKYEKKAIAFGRTGNEEVYYKGYGKLETGLRNSGIKFELLTSKFKDKTLSDQEIWDKISGGKVFVSLSVWEGFNLPIGEANALGVATVAINRGAHSEVADAYFDDAEEVIAHLNKDSAPTRRMNFNWTNACLNLLKVT